MCFFSEDTDYDNILILFYVVVVLKIPLSVNCGLLISLDHNIIITDIYDNYRIHYRPC